ncbi:MAG: hypothetical protein LUG18_07010 [Candidatus Azobacteroides sp.]|nr:hypothetical protein [Candidatus Azobacteroides sp.]
MNFSVIPSSELSNWQNILRLVLSYDMYQTSEYNNLFTRDEKSVLFFFQQDSYKIALPLLIRNIKDTPYKDATSVYGYAGLLTNKKYIPDEIKNNFRKCTFNYFKKNNIICAFSRLHPLIPSSDNFPEKMGRTEYINKTVYIDLSLPPNLQTAQYSASLRRQLKKISHSNITFRIGEKSEYKSFISLYYKTMDRLNADPDYYFSEKYFEKLIFATDFESLIIFAENEQTIIGSGLFTCCNQFMQYHLGAVPQSFLPFSPLKGIIDMARKIGSEKKLKYLHLGGGYHGNDGGLFEFKSRFSKERASFKVWKWIVNENIYHEMVKNKFGNHIPENNFFPLYRLND